MANKHHHTFFGKIFGSAWDAFKSIFEAANHAFLDAAIGITQKVKEALNSKLIAFLTSVIPGNIDDKIVEFLKEKVPILLADELMIQAAGTPSTPEEVQDLETKLIDSFGGLTDKKKEKFYTSVAASIYIFLQEHKNGEKVTFGQAARLVETAYEEWQQLQKDEAEQN